MRIRSVDTYIVNQELENGQAFAFSQAWYNSRTILLLKVTTDDGVVGWGESFGPAFVNKTLIDKYFAPMIIGRDPLDSSVIWESLYNKFRDHSPRGNAIEAISAIDIALWDIKGKAMGVPIYKLLGGATREKVTPYATGLYRRTIPSNVNELVNEAIEYVKQGFSAIKIKIGFGIEDDVNCVREIRKTVGDKVKLMVDANHAYNASNAILLSRSIEEYDITWFEEPVPPEDISGYIEVKSKTSIPVSGGEAEFCRYGFNTLLGQRAVDIVQPDCCVTGGISEFQKISVLASIYNIQCYPHIWGSSIAVHAGLHCALALPDFPNALIPAPMYLEYDRTPNIFRERLASHPLIITDGLIKAPTGSGLGIDVDEDLIKNHSIA